jgi:hypothetical protein
METSKMQEKDEGMLTSLRGRYSAYSGQIDGQMSRASGYAPRKNNCRS